MTESDSTRRRALVLGGAAAGAALGLGISSCSSSNPGSDAAGGHKEPSPAPRAELCVLNSSVTQGPYYLDGALLRKDITEGKKGVPLTVRLTVRDQPHACAPLKNAAVEIWHCDAWGYYSGYTSVHPGGKVPAASADTSGANPRTYLRGVQITGADGVAEFTTIFPGWYTGRATHIHVKVHTGGKRIGPTYKGGRLNWTGQLFFADRYADAVYARAPYHEHTGIRTRLAHDPVYHGGGARDGLMSVTGGVDAGFVATLTVGVDTTRDNTGGTSAGTIGGTDGATSGGTADGGTDGATSAGTGTGGGPTGPPVAAPSNETPAAPSPSGTTPYTPPPDSAASASRKAPPDGPTAP